MKKIKKILYYIYNEYKLLTKKYFYKKAYYKNI
jgi:hypothetical protein